MSADVIRGFLDAMAEHGLEPVEPIIPDGKLHRICWRDDNAGSSPNGAYVLHLDGRPAGFFQCFKRGIKETWCAKGKPLSEEERRAFADKMKAEAKRREMEQRERHPDAAAQANAILDDAADAPADHSYLAAKGVGALGLKVDGKGNLLVKICDIDGETHSLQTTARDGTKRFLKGRRKDGLFHMLGVAGNDLEQHPNRRNRLGIHNVGLM